MQSAAHSPASTAELPLANWWTRNAHVLIAAAVYAEIDRYCATHQVPYIQADVNVPFDELILRVFRRGGFLR